jgi:tetratricopeptide (TPR) repeat protein
MTVNAVSQDEAAIQQNAAEVHFNIGVGYEDAGQYEQAIDSYRAALQFSPEMMKAHMRLALACMILGRPEEALEQCRALEAIDPDIAAILRSMLNRESSRKSDE